MNEEKDERVGGGSSVGKWLDLDSSSSPGREIENDLRQEQCEQLFVHALLKSHLEPESKRVDRISTTLARFEKISEDKPETSPDGMRKVEDASVEPSEVVGQEQNSGAKQVGRNTRRLMLVSSLAASLLAIGGLRMLVSPPSAEAAMSRALAATREDVTRRYAGSVSLRIFGKRKESEVEFYSHSFEMFAAEFKDMSRKPFVIGSDGEKRWLVAGNWSWNSDSDLELPRDFWLNRVTLRNLQFNQLLSRIPDCYSVAFLEEMPLPGSKSVQCRPIEATLRVNETRLPKIIRLWPHPNTGVIHQIQVIRQEGRLAALRVEARLSGELDMTKEYFTEEYHLSR